MTDARKTLLSQITEADFQRQVIDLARLYGWKVHHTRPAQYQSGRWATPIQGDPGFPDLVVARNGIVRFLELKSEKGRIRPEQASWLDALPLSRRSGVYRPSNFDELRELLR